MRQLINRTLSEATAGLETSADGIFPPPAMPRQGAGEITDQVHPHAGAEKTLAPYSECEETGQLWDSGWVRGKSEATIMARLR
jgi:hypothetical protein